MNCTIVSLTCKSFSPEVGSRADIQLRDGRLRLIIFSRTKTNHPPYQTFNIPSAPTTTHTCLIPLLYSSSSPFRGRCPYFIIHTFPTHSSVTLPTSSLSLYVFLSATIRMSLPFLFPIPVPYNWLLYHLYFFFWEFTNGTARCAFFSEYNHNLNNKYYTTENYDTKLRTESTDTDQLKKV